MECDAATRRRLPDDSEAGFWTAPDGCRIRTLRLRPKAGRRGAILFAGGRADYFEKYLESLIHWRARGWDVTAFDWRGQGGSGVLPDTGPRIGHIADFSVWLQDAAALARHWRETVEGPHMLIGHSMGGHLMLRHVAGEAPPVKGLVLSSPMVSFRTPLPGGLVRRIAQWMVKRGRGEDYALGQRPRPAAANSIRQRRLTSDVERYADELWWNGANPAHVLGGASWGWLDAAYRSIDALEAPGVAEGISVPVLLAASAGDRVVHTGRAVKLVKRIPRHEIALFDGAHELLRERDDVRRAIWERIDRFMEDNAQC